MLKSRITKNKVFGIIIIFIIAVQTLLIYKGGKVFRTTSLSINEFIFMVMLSFTVIPVDWLRKLILKKKGVIVGV